MASLTFNKIWLARLQKGYVFGGTGRTVLRGSARVIYRSQSTSSLLDPWLSAKNLPH